LKSSSVTSSGSNKPDSALARRAANAFDILADKTGVLGLAVSGGSDSTALLAFAADWARARGARLVASTVDHGLRPEAAEETRGVAELCAALDVSHTTLTWIRPDDARSVAQAEARRARHTLLADWARASGAGVIALGHTRDDRIETFLMRARQGSGWHGLAGPLPSGPSPAWPSGRGLRLIRPLLAFGREELREELRGRTIGWIEDPSNRSDKFERVRMRALMGRMEKETHDRALRVMDRLAGMRAAVIAEARASFASVETSDSEARIPVEGFRRIGAEARLRLLEALVMAAGGAETPPRREALDRLVSRASESAGAIGMTLGGAWIRLEKTSLTVSRAPPRREDAANPPPSAPIWERARDLLADPRLAALGV
jgi:tRNA(Ile)-lysidine synthase